MSLETDLSSEIEALLRDLVRTPSQGFLDPLDGVFGVLSDWLRTNGIPWTVLRDSAGAVALQVTLSSGVPGPVVCLDACVDTAPVGRRELWTDDPFSAAIRGDKLHGRGAADSKAAVSIFCHLARELHQSALVRRGTLHILLDGDEHTGNFGGIKAFVKATEGRVSFVAVGYPGHDRIAIGARGFFRVALQTFGEEVHSGSVKRPAGPDAILKMAHLVELLSRQVLPAEPDPDFAFGPSLNVTAMQSGEGFSQIPGVCRANVDARLTPAFDAQAARLLITSALEEIDKRFPSGEPSTCEELESWPCYEIEKDSLPVRILAEAAEEALARKPGFFVSGPSNIGNYLARWDIPATCGFGVAYENLHAPNECIALESVLPVYRTYREAVIRWLAELPVL